MKRLFLAGTALTLFIFAVNFYLVGFGVISDGQGYYAPLRSIVFDGDLSVRNEYEFFSTSASKFGGGIRWSDPIPEYSKYTIGMGALLSPFFISGHVVALGLQGVGLDVATDGLSWPYELFYCLGSLLLGLGGLVLCYRAAKERFGAFEAALATAAIWFASPLTFYITMETSMSHAVSQFAVSLFLYLCLTESWTRNARMQILLGLTLGLAMLIRPQNVLFGVVPLILFLSDRDARSGIVKGLSGVALIGLVALCIQIPQALVYDLQYDGLLNAPYFHEGKDVGEAASFDWLRPNVLLTLFSGYHGLFSWHPALLLGVVGLFFAIRKTGSEATSLLVAFGLQLYLVAAWWCWWQGASFGGRMFCNCSFVFVFGLAALWSTFRGRVGRIAAVLATLCVMGWNALLVMQLESGMINAQDPITNAQLIKGQFKALPHFVGHVLER